MQPKAVGRNKSLRPACSVRNSAISGKAGTRYRFVWTPQIHCFRVVFVQRRTAGYFAEDHIPHLKYPLQLSLEQLALCLFMVSTSFLSGKPARQWNSIIPSLRMAVSLT